MDRKKIGFRENGGESSSLMAYKPEQCSKQLNHSFSCLFFCLLVCLGAVSLLRPYSIHHSFFDFHSQSPCFSPDRRDRTKRNNVSRVWFSAWSANELIEPSEYLSSLYLQQLLNRRPSPSIYPLISEGITFPRKAPTRDHGDDGKLPHKLSSHALPCELLFTEGRFDIRCALISWWARRVRVSEAQN